MKLRYLPFCLLMGVVGCNKEDVELGFQLDSNEPLIAKSNVELKVKIELPQGWKINEVSPSRVQLFRITGTQKNLEQEFYTDEIRKKNLKLTPLKNGSQYLLKSALYFCEEKKGSLCMIRNIEKEIFSHSDQGTTEVNLVLKPNLGEVIN